MQALVDGIAKSGKWLDQSMEHRMSAAQFVSKNYYMQDPRLLTFVLSKPPDRVKYTRLTPLKPDFEEIETLGRESGILKGTAHFEDYVDPSFAEAAANEVGGVEIRRRQAMNAASRRASPAPAATDRGRASHETRADPRALAAASSSPLGVAALFLAAWDVAVRWSAQRGFSRARSRSRAASANSLRKGCC